jgi:hypothetical protein
LPSSDALLQRLRPLVGAGHDGVTLVARQPNASESHYASEVVTCGLPDGRRVRLLVKYGDGEDRMGSGLRCGPAYEAVVYQQVLAPFGVHVPRCYGSWREPGEGIDVLVLEYVGGVHVHRVADHVEGIGLAAGWIGHLQAQVGSAVGVGALPSLNVYDADLYRYWTARTREFERRTLAGRAWLTAFCDRIDQVSDTLCGAPQTLIHGDYYPDNMMYLDGRISVFDWEQTAIAPGEIDLASVTNGWQDEVVLAAEDAYCRARWPDGAPASFPGTLEAARIYVLMRLLGEARGWPNRATRRWRVDLLRQSAERLGLL